MSLGILREVKNKWERRVAIIPRHVQKLTSMGVKVFVQPSEKRVFKDIEFERAGAIMTDDMSRANCILGVKEFPATSLMKDKSYMIFSHTIKAQPENMHFLDECKSHNVRLFDYECIRDENERLVAFGSYAGMVGMIDCFRGLGEQLLSLGYSTPFMSVASAYMYPDLEAAKNAVRVCGDEIRRVGVPKRVSPLAFAFTGSGRVAQGAKEVFDLLPHEIITMDRLRYLREHPEEVDPFQVYGVNLGVSDLVSNRQQGVAFDKQQYYSQPDLFRPVFQQHVAPHISVLVNGMYWDARYPRLLSKDDMRSVAAGARSREQSLMAIADITCDIGGSIEFTSQATQIDDPFFSYKPHNGTESRGIDGEGIMMLSVDNLPAEVPREASETFSDALFPFLPSLAASDASVALEQHGYPDELHNACITSNGSLTRKFRYIDQLRADRERGEQGRAVDAAQPAHESKVAALLLEGHLFDTKLINQVLDLVEEQGGRFELAHFDCGATVKQPSRLVLNVWHQAPLLSSLLDTIHSFVSAADAQAQATVRELSYSSDSAQQPSGGVAVRGNKHFSGSGIAAEVDVVVHSGPQKNILVLGSGMVCAPLVDHLCGSGNNALTLASMDVHQAQRLTSAHVNASAVRLDASDSKAVSDAVAQHDLVISLLPAPLHPAVARLCIQHGKNMVTASYVSPDMRALHSEAQQAGVTIMNEVGLDPGIDHMSAMQIIDQVKQRGGSISTFHSLCGGLPAPEAALNPLGYKFSWSPMGVLTASQNAAQYLHRGEAKRVPGEELLRAARPFRLGPAFRLEHIPNRDSIPYAEVYDIPEASTVYRATLRYQDFCGTLACLTSLGLLQGESMGCLQEGATSWVSVLAEKLHVASDPSVVEDKCATVLRDAGFGADEIDNTLHTMRWLGLFSVDELTPAASRTSLDALCGTLQHKLAFEEGERDMVLMHHALGVKQADGGLQQIKSTLLCYGDEQYSAMARTVGLPTAMTAQLLLDGGVQGTGVLVPNTKDVYEPVLQQLHRSGIVFKEETSVVQDLDRVDMLSVL